MKTFLLLLIAGATGTAARYGLTLWIQNGPGARFEFPLATLCINVAGSFLLGLVAMLALHKWLSPELKTIVGTGFCGAFTTFSTFELEADALLKRSPPQFWLYVGGNLILGFLAVGTAQWLALKLLRPLP